MTAATALLTARILGVLRDVPSRGSGREALVQRIVGVAERLRRDEVVMSVFHSAPELAMVYIAERLGTSQQILIDAVAADLEVAQREGSVRAPTWTRDKPVKARGEPVLGRERQAHRAPAPAHSTGDTVGRSARHSCA